VAVLETKKQRTGTRLFARVHAQKLLSGLKN